MKCKWVHKAGIILIIMIIETGRMAVRQRSTQTVVFWISIGSIIIIIHFIIVIKSTLSWLYKNEGMGFGLVFLSDS